MVDLNKCKPGDTLISQHGLELEYVRKKSTCLHYKHEVKYPDGRLGTRTDDGYTFKSQESRSPGNHNIVEIIASKSIVFDTSCKKCKEPGGFDVNNEASQRFKVKVTEYLCMACGHWNNLKRRKGYKEWDADRSR